MFYRNKRSLIFLTAFMLLFQLHAGAESNEPLKLDVLVEELVKVNPDIQAADLRYQAAMTRPSRQSALPDPRLNFGWMSAGTILPGGKLGEDPNANIGLQVSQEFPYPGKRDLMSEMARKEADSERQMRSATVRSRIAALKTAFYELCFTYDALELLARNQENLRQLSRVAEVRYTVGKAMQQDLVKAGIEVAILQNRMIALEQRKQTLSAEINMLLNRSSTSFLGRPENVPLPPLDLFDVFLEKARQSSPMLLSRKAITESKETGIKLAKKEYYPDFEVMMGYYNLGELEDMWEVRAEFSIPVFYKSKQRKQVQEATLQVGEARQNHRSTGQMVEFKLRDAYLKAETSRKLMELYSQQIVPQSELAFDSSLASYETGGVDFLTILSNFSTILEYQMNRLEQQTEYLKAHAVLDELTGGDEQEKPAEEAQS